MSAIVFSIPTSLAVSNNVTVGGTLTVGGTSTFDGLATFTAGLTISSGALTAVAITSPASSNLTLNTASANSVIIQTNGLTGLTIDASQNATFTGITTAPLLNVTSVANTNAQLIINKPATSQDSLIAFQTAGANDWLIYTPATSSPNLRINNGSADLFIINHTTGAATLQGTSGAGGSVQLSINNSTATGYSELALGTDQGSRSGFVDMNGSTASGNVNAMQIGTSLSGPLKLYTNSTLAVTIDTSQNVSFTGGIGHVTSITSIGTITINTGAGSSNLTLNANAGQQKEINFASANSTRWIVYSDGETESGGNAGSNFRFDAYADDSSGISTWLQIQRATGVVIVNSNTATTSTTTGALVIAGGVGTGGSIVAGGNIQVSGTVGVGGSALSYLGINLQRGLSGSTSQYGVVGNAVFGSDATVGAAIYAQVSTTASSYALTSGYGVYIAAPSIGSTSSITTNTGLYIVSQTGASTNYAIYTNSGAVRLGDTMSIVGNVAIGTSTNASYGFIVNAATSGTSQYGVFQETTFTSTATTLGMGMYSQIRTASAGFTMQNAYGLFIDTAILGSGSAINTNYGLYINSQTAGSANWAVYTNGTTPSLFGGSVIVNGNLGVGSNSVAAGYGLHVDLDPGLAVIGSATSIDYLGVGSNPFRVATAGIAYGFLAGLNVASGTQTYGVNFCGIIAANTTNITHILLGTATPTTGDWGIYDTSGYAWSVSGVIQAGGYKSSDGTAGLTQASTATSGKSITVKNGLIVAFA